MATMSTGIDDSESGCEENLVTVQELLNGSDEHRSFLCVDAYFDLKLESNEEEGEEGENEVVSIKVSTYHDVKEVKWDRAEKQSSVERKILVMGTKVKEERFNQENGLYGLRYWMIFEVQPHRKFQTSLEETNGEAEFRSLGSEGFKYQHIKKDSEPHGNLKIRKEKISMFQINFCIDNHVHDLEKVPVNDEGDFNGHQKQYLQLEEEMKYLWQDITKYTVMEYTKFIARLKEAYKKFKLKQLDSFVI